jgi:Tfp pilus assembly protein PilX
MPTATAQPTLKTSTKPDMPLPTVPAAALVATEEWRIVMGKATQQKAKSAEAKKKWIAIPRDETPNKTNGGLGKKAHQPTTNHHHDMRTWADVVRSRGINVQIVLGNGNLGTTQLETRKKETRDRARDRVVRWLGRKREGGERGGM